MGIDDKSLIDDMDPSEPTIKLAFKLKPESVWTSIDSCPSLIDDTEIFSTRSTFGSS